MRLYFVGLFHTFPRIKSPLLVKNAWDVYNHEKKGINVKQPWQHSICRCSEENSIRIFFLQVFNSSGLISWDFIGSPQIIIRKNSQKSKTQDFISRFFSRNFFPVTFLHRFGRPWYSSSKYIFTHYKQKNSSDQHLDAKILTQTQLNLWNLPE